MRSCGMQPATPYWSLSSFCKQVVRSCRVGPPSFVRMLRNREALVFRHGRSDRRGSERACERAFCAYGERLLEVPHVSERVVFDVRRHFHGDIPRAAAEHDPL